MMDTDTIRDMLAAALAANARHVAARIDAGACGTERDYRWMHECEDKAREAVDAFIADVLRLVQDERDHMAQAVGRALRQVDRADAFRKER